MQKKTARGGDGLAAEGVAFYGRMLRSVKATYVDEEEWVHLWNEIWEEEKDNHVKGKQ